MWVGYLTSKHLDKQPVCVCVYFYIFMKTYKSTTYNFLLLFLRKKIKHEFYLELCFEIFIAC